MTDAIRDNNHVTVAIGVSSTDSTTPTPFKVDPATGRLLVDAAGGYTNLTEFVDQTAWRLFYSNTDGDVVELAFGTSGQVLQSNGATSAPTFETVAGTGDMVLADVQTITGAKTFNADKLIHAGSTSGTTVVKATAIAGTTVLTLPAATDTLVGKATTDTLTNKTLTSPVINSPTNIVTDDVTESTDKNYVTDAEAVVIGNTSNTNTGDEATASITVSGISESATVAETDTGTDAVRHVTPASLAGSALQTKADSVETNADVTDTANVTSAGALMDSELTDIAAVKALSDASIADTDTGTSTTAFVTPDGLQGSKRNLRWLSFNLVEAATDCATATNIAGDFVSPIAGVIQQSDTTPFYLYATNSTAGTTGTMVVDISIGGTSIMTTNKLDFDTTEKTTTTAATPPDLTTTALAVGDIITIDIDAVHTTAAKGLTVYLAVLES